MRKVKRSDLVPTGEEVDSTLSKIAAAVYYDRRSTNDVDDEIIIELHDGDFIALIAYGQSYCSASLGWDDVEIVEDREADAKPTN